MNEARDEVQVQAVLAAALEDNGQKRLSCAEAFRLAAEFNVKPSEIGRISNEHHIKISKCQLGCF